MRAGTILGFSGPLICLALGGMTADAQNLPLGSKVRGSFQLEGRSIPLLEGDWTVVSTGGSSASNMKVDLTRAILAQMEGNRLSRWLYVNTNAELSSTGGWVRNKDICDRKDAHAGYSDTNYSTKDTECWTLNHYGLTLGAKPSQIYVDFYRWSDGRHRPNTALALAYFIVKKGDFLHAQYYFNPVVAGFPDTPTADWRGNPWHIDMASKDTKKLEYLRGLKATGEKLFNELRAVMK